MYQPPKLNVIGDARDIVLGVVDNGLDLDTTHFISDWEFGDDHNQPIPPRP